MAPKKKLKVLVTGATGHQGGAVAQALLLKGHHVRAFTRVANSPAAQALKAKGIDIAQGSFEDPASLEIALKGMDAVFAVMTFRERGPAGEIQQGKQVADAVKVAGTRFMVYSSVSAANLNTGIPHFDSKFIIEQYIQQLGLPHTIIRPVAFMDNLLNPYNMSSLAKGILQQMTSPGKRNQVIAVEDIGKFTAFVIEKQQQFLSKSIDIAGDELSGEETAAILSRVLNRQIKCEEQPPGAIAQMGPDFAKMIKWTSEIGYHVNIGQLRQKYAEISWLTFENWAKKQDWSILDKAMEKPLYIS